MDINFAQSGAPNGPPLLLAHSLATNMAMWDDVMPALEANFRVVRYDLRGHGRTPPFANRCTLLDFQDDAIALLDHLEVDRANFVGLSLGGMIGLGLGLDHPNRISRLVVCNAGAATSPSGQTSWDERIASVRTHGIESLIEPTLERWFTRAYQTNKAAMDTMRAMMRTTSPRGYVCAARAIKALALKDRLSELSVPTLFVTGELDQGAPPNMVKDLHERVPGSLFLEIKGAAHMSAVEMPEAVGAAIAHFLTDSFEGSGLSTV